jgi:hypothetical protein
MDLCRMSVISLDFQPYWLIKKPIWYKNINQLLHVYHELLNSHKIRWIRDAITLLYSEIFIFSYIEPLQILHI